MPSSVLFKTLLGFIALVIWAFSALVALEVVGIPPFQLLTCQFFLAFFFIFIRFLCAKNKPSYLCFSKKDFFAAVAALTLSQMSYLTAFRFAPPAQVDLINYTWPTWIIVLTPLLPNESFRLSYLVACVLCMLGVYTLLNPTPWQGFGFEYQYLLGYLMAAMSSLSWACYSVYSRYRRKTSSHCILWATSLPGIFCFVAHLHYEEFVVPNTSQYILIGILGLVQLGLGFFLWEMAIKKGHVQSLSLATYGVPVLSVIILSSCGKAVISSKLILACSLIVVAPVFPLVSQSLTKTLRRKRLKVSKILGNNT